MSESYHAIQLPPFRTHLDDSRIAEKFRTHVLPYAGDACWGWDLKPHPNGYSYLFVAGKRRLAHRISYELFKGPIPEGLHIDHLCRNRACVNPDHLEPVTNRENFLRGIHPNATKNLSSHCPNGHLRNEENTVIRIYRGMNCKYCLICERERQHELRKNGRLGMGKPREKHLLSPNIEQEIRALSQSGVPQRALANRYGVGKSTIARILHRKGDIHE